MVSDFLQEYPEYQIEEHYHLRKRYQAIRTLDSWQDYRAQNLSQELLSSLSFFELPTWVQKLFEYYAIIISENFEFWKVGEALNLPKEGDLVTIQSYKHDGSLHRTWRDTMILKTNENSIIGVNDHTLVTESDDRRWVTREPAIVYFHKKFWFNIIAMIREEGVSYYCNIASPFVLDNEALKYIDYDLDVKVFIVGRKKPLAVEKS